MESDTSKVGAALRERALELPGATEEFPWGERVVKVNKKIFIFLGKAGADGGELSFSVKLPDSSFAALEMHGAQPTGYGLGKSGWVTLRFAPGECPPVDFLLPWVEES